MAVVVESNPRPSRFGQELFPIEIVVPATPQTATFSLSMVATEFAAIPVAFATRNVVLLVVIGNVNVVWTLLAATRSWLSVTIADGKVAVWAISKQGTTEARVNNLRTCPYSTAQAVSLRTGGRSALSLRRSERSKDSISNGTLS